MFESSLARGQGALRARTTRLAGIVLLAGLTAASVCRADAIASLPPPPSELYGDLFVAGRFSNAAYRYDGTTGAFELTIGSGVLNTAFGLDFGPDGNLYVASGGASRINRFNPITGADLGAFVPTASGGLSSPIGIEFGTSGELFAASFNTDSIKAYNGTTGAYLGDRVAAGSDGLDSPNYFTVAVPEPMSVGLLAMGAAVVGSRRRRR